MTEEQIVERVARAILDVANAELQLCDAEADDFARAVVALLGPAPLEWVHRSRVWLRACVPGGFYDAGQHSGGQFYWTAPFQLQDNPAENMSAAKAAAEAHHRAAWWAQTVAGRKG